MGALIHFGGVLLFKEGYVFFEDGIFEILCWPFTTLFVLFVLCSELFNDVDNIIVDKKEDKREKHIFMFESNYVFYDIDGISFFLDKEKAIPAKKLKKMLKPLPARQKLLKLRDIGARGIMKYENSPLLLL